MTAYLGELGNGQQVYIENQENQTAIALVTVNPGQQQSQSSSFQTGTWVKPPALFRIAKGIVLRIEATEGEYFFRVQANSMSTLKETPSLQNAENIPLEQIEKNSPFSGVSMPSMKPMEPMKPMKMGNMEMQMSPNMEMKMGDIELRMNSTEKTPSTKNFCTQCGNRVSEQNRFCSHCGHSLK